MTLSTGQNPKPLFPNDILICSKDDNPWRVVHTKSRREKALANYLEQANIGYYLPMFQKRQISQNRIRFSQVPLFSGYLFLKADDADRHKAFKSNHIARMIEVKDQKQLIGELGQVQQTLSGGAPVLPWDFTQEGQRVRIKTGPMKDIEGMIVRKDRHCRLVISISSIMQALSVEIDEHCVEPVH